MIWAEPGGTVCLRTIDPVTGRTTLREFWAPFSGGYVREVSLRRPGTIGRVVCRGLAYQGETLWSTRAGLRDVIAREHRAAVRRQRRLEDA